MSTKLSIPIVLGTTRQGRQSEHVAKYLYAYIQKNRTDIETKLFDPRDMNLPQEQEGQDLKEYIPEYRDAIINADGLIVVAPEYNHSFPGTLKRILDSVLQEYVHKAVAIAGVSAGGFGGTRVIEALVPVVRELGLAVSFRDLNVSKVQDVFDEQGSPKDEKFEGRVADFIEELSWIAASLKWGRENVESKYHE